MKDMKERKCGCLVYELGPPVLCERHQAKADRRAKKEARRAEREVEKEEKGLRKVVLETAESNGHVLSKFKEYPSCPGKWTAHCHLCGSIVIVYDKMPERGDQIAGQAVFNPCHKSDLVNTLGEVDREAIAARFVKDGPDAQAAQVV